MHGSPKKGAAGLIFDFDGTIALSEPTHAAAWVDVARDAGRALPEGFLESGIGQTDERLSADLAGQWPGGPTAAQLLAAKRRAYQERCRRESPLVPGIEALLAHFHGTLPMAIATSASLGDIAPTLEMHGLGRYFDAVLTVESVTHPKPHPEIYLKAAASLGVDPTATFVFEDSPTGAAAARAAGMRVIGLLTTYGRNHIGPLVHATPDYLDLAALLAVLSA